MAARPLFDFVIKARHLSTHPERGIRLPVVDVLSLAEDVDTEEEAAALERAVDAESATED